MMQSMFRPASRRKDFFGMTRLATLLLSLGPAKLVRPTGSFWVFVPLVEGVSPLEGLVK
jgi:hypothetical protein